MSSTDATASVTTQDLVGELAAKKGLKLTWIARELGLSRDAFARRRNGQVEWSVSDATFLAELFAVPVAAFIPASPTERGGE